MFSFDWKWVRKDFNERLQGWTAYSWLSGVVRQGDTIAHRGKIDQVFFPDAFETAKNRGDFGPAMGRHLIGQLAVALGGFGLHGQGVGQQFGHGLHRRTLRWLFAHKANLDSRSAIEPLERSNSGR